MDGSATHGGLGHHLAYGPASRPGSFASTALPTPPSVRMTAYWTHLCCPKGKADTMSLFLDEVARRHPSEFILMVLDGAGWHRAGDLVIPERRRLYPLPARSPELNPAEHLWNEWREKWLANRMFDCQDAVDGQVQKGLAALEKDRPKAAALAGFGWIKSISLQPK